MPATVNILRKVFHVTPVPCMHGECRYTVVLSGSCPPDVARDVLEANGIRVLPKHYKNLHAVAIELAKPLSVKSLERLLGGCIADLVPGVLPDKEGINTYMNYEHPLLAKYFIGLALVLGHMQPWAWRLPSLIAGIAIVASVILTAALLSRREGLAQACLAMLVASVALAMDPALRAMSSVAMLDIYIGLFTILAVVAFIYDRVVLSAILAGCAASVKFSGAFVLIGFIMLLTAEGRLRDAIREVLVASAVFVLINAPLIAYLGPGGWLSQLASALSWHTTSRPSGPPYTNPFGLLLGEAPFTLYYIGSRALLVAYANPFEATAAAVVALVSASSFIILRFLRKSEATPLDRASFAYLGIVSGYVLTYVAGNHTLYSFYTIQFTPVAALILALLVGRFSEFYSRLLESYHALQAWASMPLHSVLTAKLALTAGALISWILVASLHLQPSYPSVFGFLGSAAVSVEARKYPLAILLLAAASLYLFYKALRCMGLTRASISSTLYWLAIVAGRGDVYTAIAPVYTVTPASILDYYVVGFLAPTPLLLAVIPPRNHHRERRWLAAAILAFLAGSLTSLVLSAYIGARLTRPGLTLWLLHMILGVVGVAASSFGGIVAALFESVYMALYSPYTPGAALVPVYRGGGGALLVAAWLVLLSAALYPVSRTAALILEVIILGLGVLEFVVSVAARKAGTGRAKALH